MAAADYANVVQQLYVSYFGRPADYYGLQNFEAQLNTMGAPTTVAGIAAAVQAGTNVALVKLVNSFNAAPESVALYGAGTTQIEISKFVAGVYTNVLGRPADVAGANWWINEIVSGRLTKANAALAISAGALTNTTDQGKIDAATITAKVAVASDFTTSLDTIPEINAFSGDAAAAAARAMLATVTNTTTVATFHATVDATIAALGTAATAGQTFTLTAGVGEVVNGTTGNDVFKAVLGDPAVAGSSTLNIGDIIDGKTGVDTLDLVVSVATALPLGAQVSNVEKIVVTNGATSLIAIDAAVFVGAQEITLKDNATAVNVSNIDGLKLGVQGVAAAAVKGTYALTTAQADLVLTAAKGQVELVGAGVKTLNISGSSQVVVGAAQIVEVIGTAATTGLTTLNVDASAALKLDVDAVIAPTVNVKGAGAVDLQALNAAAKTLNASANTGGVTATIAHVDAQVTGGAGKDVVSLNNATALTSAAGVNLGAGDDSLLKIGAGGVGTTAVIDGGDGKDTISSKLLEVANQANIKNWEILDLAGETRTIDASLFKASTFESLALSGALGGSTVVQNLAGTALNFNIAAASGVFDLTASLKNAATGTSDVGNLTYANTLAADTLVQSFKSAGLESVNIVSGGKAATTLNTLSLLSDSLNQLKTVSITGDNAFTLSDVTTNTAATTATANVASALTLIDGSTAKGALTITAGTDVVITGAFSTTYTGLTIKTGSGADNVTSAAKGAVISTGAGDDIITVTGKGAIVDTGAAKVDSATGDVVNVGAANVVVTVGAGLQKIVVGTAAAAGTALDQITSVTGAAKGDIIDLSGLLTTKADVDAITNVTTAVGTAASLTEALALAANANGVAATGDLVFFAWVDGNTYLVADKVGALTGGLTGADDAVVKLVGTYTTFTALDGVVTLG